LRREFSEPSSDASTDEHSDESSDWSESSSEESSVHSSESLPLDWSFKRLPERSAKDEVQDERERSNEPMKKWRTRSLLLLLSGVAGTFAGGFATGLGVL